MPIGDSARMVAETTAEPRANDCAQRSPPPSLFPIVDALHFPGESPAVNDSEGPDSRLKVNLCCELVAIGCNWSVLVTFIC